jgi:hypothetical protein
MATEASLAQKGLNNGLDQLLQKPATNSFFQPIGNLSRIFGKWLMAIFVNVHL